MKVHEALTAVMNDVKAVGKDGRNQQQGFNFRGIDGTLNAVGPALRKHGVIVAPEVLSVERGDVLVGQKQTRMGHVIVTVRYRWFGPEGDFIDSVTIGEAMDSGDKAASKAMSVAFRTAMLQTLALPTDEPDPDQDMYERAAIDPAEFISRIEMCSTVAELEVVGAEVAKAHLTRDALAQIKDAGSAKRKELQGDAE